MELDSLLNNLNLESLNIKDLHLLLKILNDFNNKNDEVEVL